MNLSSPQEQKPIGTVKYLLNSTLLSSPLKKKVVIRRDNFQFQNIVSNNHITSSLGYLEIKNFNQKNQINNDILNRNQFSEPRNQLEKLESQVSFLKRQNLTLNKERSILHENLQLLKEKNLKSLNSSFILNKPSFQSNHNSPEKVTFDETNNDSSKRINELTQEIRNYQSEISNLKLKMHNIEKESSQRKNEEMGILVEEFENKQRNERSEKSILIKQNEEYGSIMENLKRENIRLNEENVQLNTKSTNVMIQLKKYQEEMNSIEGSYKSQIREMKEKDREKRSFIEDLERNLKQNKDSNSSDLISLTELRRKNEDLTMLNEELRTERSNLLKKNSDAATNENNYRNQLERMDNEVLTLRKKEEQQRDYCENLLEKLDQLRILNENIQNEVSSSTKEQNAIIDNLQKKNESLILTLEEKEEEISFIKKLGDKSKSEKESLLEQRIEDLNQEHLEERKNFENTISELSSNLRDLKGNYHQKERNLSELTQEFTENKTRFELLQQQNFDTNESFETLKREFNQIENELNQLKETMAFERNKNASKKETLKYSIRENKSSILLMIFLPGINKHNLRNIKCSIENLVQSFCFKIHLIWNSFTSRIEKGNYPREISSNLQLEKSNELHFLTDEIPFSSNLTIDLNSFKIKNVIDGIIFIEFNRN